MTDPADDALENVAAPTADTFADVADDVTADTEDLDDDTRDFLESILGGSDGTVRVALRYDGDQYDLLYVRDDIADQFTDAELAERVKTLMVKGLGDPVEEGSLFDFGQLDATVRWYDAVVVAYVPTSNWSGLVFTFDRVSGSLADLAEDHFGA